MSNKDKFIRIAGFALFCGSIIFVVVVPKGFEYLMVFFLCNFVAITVWSILFGGH